MADETTAIYTIVDEGYSVTVCNSTKEVYRWVRGDHRWLDEEHKIPLTEETLSTHLKVFSVVRIYEGHFTDWLMRVQHHG